jgi:hypothetical protein
MDVLYSFSTSDIHDLPTRKTKDELCTKFKVSRKMAFVQKDDGGSTQKRDRENADGPKRSNFQSNYFHNQKIFERR